jgi:hypothetical protein
MAICENCGMKYAPTASAPDCPNCAPDEASEPEEIVPRRKQPAASGAPAASNRPATPPPQRAAPPQAQRAPAPQPQRPAAQQRAPAPQQRAAAPPARSAAPQRAPSRAVPPPEPAHHGHHFQHPELLKKPGIDPIVKIGFGIAAGLMIVTAIVYFTVQGIHGKEIAQINAEEDARRELRNYINDRDVNSEQGAREIIAKADATKAMWENDNDLRNLVTSAVTKAHATLDQSQQRKDAEAKLVGIESALKNVAGLNSDNVKDLQTQLSELARLELPVEAFNKRVKDATDTCGRLYGTKLHDDSIAFANSNASQPRLGLNRYYQAEEELKRMLDAAYNQSLHGKNDEEKKKGEEDKKFYEPMYKEIVESADRTALQLFTGEEIDKISYMDLLSGPQADNWNPKKYKAVNGGLDVDATDPALKAAPLVSILDREAPRNFVIDMEFTLDRGSATVFFHLGKNISPNTQLYDLKTEGQAENVTAGKTTAARCAIIGDQFTWRFLDSSGLGDMKPAQLPWAFTRKGAIGFQVNPGSKLKITKLKVKILQ